ncbi:hypothetical protein D3C81_1639430 [compost metagenome]
MNAARQRIILQHIHMLARQAAVQRQKKFTFYAAEYVIIFPKPEHDVQRRTDKFNHRVKQHACLLIKKTRDPVGFHRRSEQLFVIP